MSLRRQEDKDLMQLIAVALVDLKSNIKLLVGDQKLLLFRVANIEKKLGIEEK